MVSLPLLAVSFIMNVVAVLFVVCCVVLVLIILIQKGRGGGLSAAFGGAMASGILGSKTGDFLTWVTIVAVSVFLTFAVVLAKYYKPSAPSGNYDVKTSQEEPSANSQQPPVAETKPQAQQEPSSSPESTGPAEANKADAVGDTTSRADANQPGR